ncbi:hypothetical protein GCM10018790_52990 [Kitasatospora xanthocidica]|uniref:DUF2510 domain-containing protein n=1 Tax=Kitasatospora xanthocidica TaxID=83382 RepID=UPI0016726869|nr:DUF2510 domain-containing protein [Kitasatospora xanthocidica]GHF68513.1 hypothetical protein GCM10018790_52990 [Kitasatospora xanthocidica]
MSEQIPAGWYPDPKDPTGDPRPQRWWDGKGWTADTRPAPSDAPEPVAPDAAVAPDASDAAGAPGPETTEQPRVLEGEVLGSGPTVRYPEPPPFGAAYGSPAPPPRKPWRKPSKLVVATAVAALLGLGAGSGITYLAMDGHGDKAKPTAQHVPKGGFGPWDGYPGGPGGPGGNDGGSGDGGSGGNGGNGNGGSGDGKGNGKGNGNGKVRPNADTAIDVVNRLTLPVPNGWQAGTTGKGYAMITVGSYTCADGNGECTLGGVNTGRIDGGGTDVQAAAKADIAAVAKESYSDVTGHQELKSEAVKVNGKDGYLVRWKVDAPKGNNGYVQTVVFPSADGKGLVSVHFGFDIADKAPDVAVMDTIVKGITDYKGKLPSIPGLPGSGSGAGGAGDAGGTTT